MNDSAPRFFLYRAEPAAGPFLLGLILLAAALLLPGALRLILLLTAGGPLAFAALQRLRRGRAVWLEADGLVVQGSISGRRRRVPFPAIRGITTTRRGGLGLLYHERTDPDLPSGRVGGAPALDRLHAEPNAAFPVRPRLLATAPLHGVEALIATLRQCCPEDGISMSALDRLIRRRQWRDRLIALLALLGTPLYVMIVARVMASLL